MKLEFGNMEHIQLRDKAEKDFVFHKLKYKIKCPYCKAKAIHWFDCNLEKETIGINFDCTPSCLNSFESSETSPWSQEEWRVFFDFNGKLVEGL